MSKTFYNSARAADARELQIGVGFLLNRDSFDTARKRDVN